MRPGWVASLGDGPETGAPYIQAAINSLPQYISRCAVVYGLNVTGISFPYGNGDIHYSAASQRLIGTYFYNAYVEAQQNYAGSTTPGMIVQLFVGPIQNRALMSFTWPPDVIATSYRLTIMANGQVLGQPIVSSPPVHLQPVPGPQHAVLGLRAGHRPPRARSARPVPPTTFTACTRSRTTPTATPASASSPTSGSWPTPSSLRRSMARSFQLWEDVSGNNNKPGAAQHAVRAHRGAEQGQRARGRVLLQLVHVHPPGGAAHLHHHHRRPVRPLARPRHRLTTPPSSATNLFALFISGQEYEPDWYDFPKNDFTASSNVSLLNGNMPTIVTAEWFITGQQTETVFYINGQNAGYGYGPQFNTSTSTIEVGARVDGQYPFYGNCFELLTFNQAISDINRHQVEAYLANKYSISINSQ